MGGCGIAGRDKGGWDIGADPGIGIDTGLGIGIGAGTGLAAAIGADAGLGVCTGIGLGTGIGVGIGVGIGAGIGMGAGTTVLFIFSGADKDILPLISSISILKSLMENTGYAFRKLIILAM